ncbi:bifunctional glutamate N-acetyltransferase/amino-acid acetyltransferase ArgJ [bacterium]|nr:MAG: bifunctional glutamate N-acetyltransferase/amino-acid acetyltransferase ArgJ [bacterium]
MEWLSQRGVAAPLGFRVGAARAGIKTQGLDVALLLADEGATCAAVFTTSQVKAAPVLVSAQHLLANSPRAVVVNAGNANCCTGEAGIQNARRMCELAAQKTGLAPQQVLVCSTGIIGHALPMEKIESALASMELNASDEDAARAFMTTDLVPKFVAASAQIDGKTVTVGGQCKGVGMIGPNMAPLTVPHATMLSFLTTDAQIEAPRLQALLERAVAKSFNSVTVDGDMSTNDTAILLASGASQLEISDNNEEQFSQLLGEVCIELAKKIARDGEGATRLIQVEVSGASTEKDAQTIALSIANSPLVKTAIFGRDPNWGRIAMAAGKAGVPFDSSKLSFSLGEVELFQNGEPLPFDLATAERQLADENVFIRLQLGEGTANWTAWTCDFSYEYVKINAEYHT